VRSSDEATHWTVNVASGPLVEHVIVSRYEEQTVTVYTRSSPLGARLDVPARTEDDAWRQLQKFG
jgi:mannosyltransferase OCH1-like enzyme